MTKQQKVELAEKTAGSNYTLSNGFMGGNIINSIAIMNSFRIIMNMNINFDFMFISLKIEMSSRLQIVECENGRKNGKSKKQYDRTGHETGGGHVQSDHPTSYVSILQILNITTE